MLLNAELRRNIWLNFTAQRLILTPLIISLIIYVTYMFSGKGDSGSLSFYLACFFIFLWGVKDASETVIEEINNSTWDFQRQSTISPWSMTCGKLFGSTLFSWYGALFCLFFYAMFHANDTIFTIQQILTLILGGIFSQALALLLSLQSLFVARNQKNNKTFRYFFVGSFIGILFTRYCFHLLKQDTLLWHGFTLSAKTFSTLSLLTFIGWCLLGLQRSFCKELQYPKIPWVWALFSIFCMIYFSGFESPLFKMEQFQPLFKNIPFFIAFIIAVFLTYIALFSDTLNTIRYKKFFLRLSERNFLEALQLLPWWPISFIFAIFAGLFAIKGIAALKDLDQDLLRNFSPVTFITTSLLFILRDIFLAHFFYFGDTSKRIFGTIALYLFLAYFLIPKVFSVLKLSSLYPMFLPSYGENTPLALASLFLQIAVLSWLCRKRYLGMNKMNI